MSGQTLRALLAQGRTVLFDAGIEGGDLDARVLLAAALGVDTTALIVKADLPVGERDAESYRALIARRIAGEPVYRILGRREFWGMDFAISAETLVPRPDTETLVEAVIEALSERRYDALHVLDLGTGTGCILTAILSEFPNATGTGIDISSDALETACGNAARLGFSERARFILSDWLSEVEGCFDIVVLNPPYIREEEIADLDREVRDHDPIRALVAGADGLDAYRIIASEVSRVLATGGLLAVELGAGQEPAVTEIFAANGLRVAGPARRDLGGIARALIAWR